MGNCSSDSSGPSHNIVVTTGDKKGAGAQDVDVYITFFDVNSKSSPEIKITNFWKNDFRKGKTQTFPVELQGLGRISDIRVRRDESGKNDAWYVERIVIIYNKNQSIFPFNRWILAESDITLSEFDSVLPQFSKHKEQREKELAAKRSEYILAEKVVGAPPQSRDLPDDEQFSTGYVLDNISTYIEVKTKTSFVDLTTREFRSLSDFESLYKGIMKVPRGRKCWKNDVEFGNQRLAGVNPVMLHLVQQIPDYLAVTADLVEPHLEGQTLQSCLESKKLYLVDLRYLKEIECPNEAKLPGPTGLFYVNNSGHLVPVAIQLMPEPGKDNPVFTPADPEYTWLAAKMWFNLADASHHQSATHFAYTHLMMDGVATCANRQLSPSHPVFRLLAPHFLFIIAINVEAEKTLVCPDGWVDKAMLIGRYGFFNIIKTAWKDYNVMESGNILKDMKRRGVDDPASLPNYHYRDDATMLWKAIYDYVSMVMNSVYDMPQKLAEDTELQAWVGELSGDANFKGLPQKFLNTDELSELLTIFIFASSVQHAAVNFEQYDQYAFPPFYPSALKGTWPISKDALSEEDIIKILPDKEQCLEIMLMTYILSERGTNSLADYEMEYAYDPVSVYALKTFREELKKISATIEKRNGSRRTPYPYLNPKVIPNSISI